MWLIMVIVYWSFLFCTLISDLSVLLARQSIAGVAWYLVFLAPHFLIAFTNTQEYKNALKEDTVDYSAYTANIKRKRPTPRKGRKSSRMIGRDDEDDDNDNDDDEDYTGGARKLSNSGRKGSSRGGRQRL